MKRFVEGTDRGQSTLFPECLDDWIDENNPVRVIDAFVDTLDLAELEFEGVEPAETGRPAYHPSALLKLYVYGYLNRVQSSRRLERGAKRNGRDRADEARPAPAADRRARPHGLAAGICLQLACLGGGRYRPLQARDR
jgi:transposase